MTNPTPSDMPNYAAPIGRVEERRLRLRARNRIKKLTSHLVDYDADRLLALHDALDHFYADTHTAHDPKPRQAVTG